MDWGIWGDDDQVFEDDFDLYKQSLARERSRSSDSLNSEDDADNDLYGHYDYSGSYGRGSFGSRSALGSNSAMPPKRKPPETLEEAEFRLDLAKANLKSRGKVRVVLAIYCALTALIGIDALVSSGGNAGGVILALLMLASIVGAIWAYNQFFGDFDEIYARCAEEYDKLAAGQKSAKPNEEDAAQSEMIS